MLLILVKKIIFLPTKEPILFLKLMNHVAFFSPCFCQCKIGFNRHSIRRHFILFFLGAPDLTNAKTV